MQKQISTHELTPPNALRVSKGSHAQTKAMRHNNQLITKFLHLTSGLGLLAILTLLCMFVKPELLDKFQALSPFATESEQQANASQIPDLAMLMATPEMLANSNEIENDTNNEQAITRQFLGTQTQQQRVTSWISKRYRVANEAIDMLVSAAYLTAQETKLDPLLILSVIAIESRFNPFSESPVGAQGLMQVMSKVHHEKFTDLGGIKAALNPVANIKVGAMILKDYVQSAGSIEAGLKRYVGAAEHDTDGGYGQLVLAEYRRLKDVAAGKNVSIFATSAKPNIIAKPESERSSKKAEELTRLQENNTTLPEQIAGI